MIKTTLLFVLLLIFVATIQASNPFDRTRRPFVIGGSFMRVERKTPGANFACYNTTLGEWTEFNFADAKYITGSSNLQLKNGHIITLVSHGDRRGFAYWNLKGSTMLTTPSTVMEITSNIFDRDFNMFLSYDEKRLYVGAFFTRVGANTYTSVTYKIFAFDISSLPTLSAPFEITSNYDLTFQLNNARVFPVSNNYQLVFVSNNGNQLVQYDPTRSSWRSLNPRLSDFKLSSSNGELFAKSTDLDSTTFWKYEPSNDEIFIRVKTLTSTVADLWTVGGNAIYYTIQVSNPSFSNFKERIQNIQMITITGSTYSVPVSLSKTRLTTSSLLSRTSIDTQSISDIISYMYYDENTKQLIVKLKDNGFQVYGSRDPDNNKKNYELSYRLQPMGSIVAYNATSDSFVVPYGGASSEVIYPMNPYSSSISVTCFRGLTSYFRTWAPNFAVYDEAKDMFVAENLLSGQIDYDWQNSAPADVTAIENSDSSGIVYVGGYFRTISGVVYNSIVSRTKTGLVALGTGLRKHNLDYNSFDTLPGSVKKMVRSSDNKYLFVLGDFNRAGDLLVNGLAYWNIEKKTWNKLENNIHGTVLDIDYDGRYLYAVGSFTKAGRYTVKNVARFDMRSETWLPMSDGLTRLEVRDSFGFVVNGRFVALSGSASGVRSLKNLAVWSSNSWRAIEMNTAYNSGCSTGVDREVCTSNLPYTSVTFYKGKLYFLSDDSVYVTDTSMSKGTLFIDGSLTHIGDKTRPVTDKTKFFNYPKSNTLVVATLGTTGFVEYNTNTKNVQHTTTRDGNIVADFSVNAISSAPKNVFTAIALIVTLVVSLFFNL